MGPRLHTRGMGGFWLCSATFSRILRSKNQFPCSRDQLSLQAYDTNCWRKSVLTDACEKLSLAPQSTLVRPCLLVFSDHLGGFQKSFYQFLFRNKYGMIWRQPLEHTILLFRPDFLRGILAQFRIIWALLKPVFEGVVAAWAPNRYYFWKVRKILHKSYVFDVFRRFWTADLGNIRKCFFFVKKKNTFGA